MAAAKKTAIFVYGSLRQGGQFHGILENSKGPRMARTEAQYSLVNLGAFPGLVAGGETAVVGEVYLVDRHTLARLDQLEGHPDFFQRGPLRLETGEEVQAYLLPAQQAEGRPAIPSGDWMKTG